jgi:hypothetical protein
VKKHWRPFLLGFVALFSVACASNSGSIMTTTYYTIRYFDDSDTPKECGYSYVRSGQAAVFHPETESYGSAYTYNSVKTAPIGHYFAFDGWYLKDGDGNFASAPVDLTSITAAFVDSHGVSAASNSVSASSTSSSSASQSDSSSDSASGETTSSSAKPTYTVADKELHVYAHFVDRRFQLTLEYMDGVDYVRTPNNRPLRQSVTFGAGTGEKIAGPVYFCPHCHKILYSTSLESQLCPDCGTAMTKETNLGLSMYQVLTEADHLAETNKPLSGHPDYGYKSVFNGWNLQKDFVDVDGDGNADVGYIPDYFTAIDANATFTGGDTIPATGKKGDLFLKANDTVTTTGTDGKTTTTTGNFLYCYVEPSGTGKWIRIGQLDSKNDPLLILSAHYSSDTVDFKTKFFSAKLANDITEANAAKETTTYLGDGSMATSKFRAGLKVVATWTTVGSVTTVSSSLYVCDSIDKATGDVTNPVQLTTFTTSLFPNTANFETATLAGYYYGDSTILPQYRGRPIDIKRLTDVADANTKTLTLLVLSTDGPGYLYPVYN